MKKFLSFYPGNSSQIDRQGRFPLHLAVSVASTDLSVVEKLIECNAEAVQAQDKQGLLPLHCVLRCSASMEVSQCLQIVQCLLNHYPHGVKVADHSGSTPLHIACHHRCPQSIVEVVLNAFPAAVHVRDQNGCIPLHAACRHGSSLEVVKSLARSDATMVHAIDNCLELPLHKACRGGHTDLINFLVAQHEPSSGERTASGALPVSLLCQRSGKTDLTILDTPQFTETVWRLIKAHPNALKTKD